MSDYNITLDLQKANTQCFLNMVRGDTGNRIIATFTGAGTADYLDGKDVVFSALKTDGTFIYDSVNVEDDTATYECDVQLCTVKGLVLCSFIIMEGTAIKKSPQFFVVVNPNMDDNRDLVEPSDSKLSALTYLYNYILTQMNEGAFSPEASVTKVGDTATITITDKTGTTTVTVKDGAKGEKGDPGEKGDTPDISGKVDKTQKIAGLALSGDISKTDLADAIMNKIFLSMRSTQPGAMGQYGLDTDGDPCVNLEGLNVWTKLALAQTSLPEVATVEYQGSYVVDTSDSSFQNLKLSDLFTAEISEVVRLYMKVGSSSYITLTDVSAWRTEINNLNSAKMDYVPFLYNDAASVEEGQIFMYQGTLYLRTSTGALPITTGTEIPL